MEELEGEGVGKRELGRKILKKRSKSEVC